MDNTTEAAIVNDSKEGRKIVEETEAYFLNMYGTCELGAFNCKCLHEWRGRACPHWKPLGVRNHEELRKYHDRHMD